MNNEDKLIDEIHGEYVRFLCRDQVAEIIQLVRESDGNKMKSKRLGLTWDGMGAMFYNYKE